MDFGYRRVILAKMDARKDFPILKRKINGKPLVYLDNAATTQKPRQVLDAVNDFYENHCGNPGRGLHTLSRDATEALESARAKVAKFINARPEEIIFTAGATEALNFAAHMICRTRGSGLSPSDSILTTVMEHHANYLPWKRECTLAGAKLKVADIAMGGKRGDELDMADFERKVGKGTKAVAATHASNVLGCVNPAKEMAKIAHDAGAVFVLDGAQSVPHMPVDVKKLDCDFLAFSGHKMLAPMGVGVLFGKYDLIDGAEPLLVGGGMVSKSYTEPPEYQKPPQRFEAGTQDVGGAVGLGSAVDCLQKIGMDKVEKHEEELTKRALRGISGIRGVETYGPKDRVGIVSFNVGGMADDDVAAIMDEQGIAVRSGHHCAQPLMRRLGIDGCARMSFYVYNTKEEVDNALGVLGKISSLR